MNSNFRKDEESNFVNFGVSAEQKLDCGTTVNGLAGYLSDLPRREVIPNVNDFSVVWHKKVAKLCWGTIFSKLFMCPKLHVRSWFEKK